MKQMKPNPQKLKIPKPKLRISPKKKMSQLKKLLFSRFHKKEKEPSK